MMNQNLSTLTVGDLNEMLVKIKTLYEQDPVLELIEISESFEAAMSHHGVDEPKDHLRLLMILGLVSEMERRMKELESALDRISTRIQALSIRGPDTGPAGLTYRLPKHESHEICE